MDAVFAGASDRVFVLHSRRSSLLLHVFEHFVHWEGCSWSAPWTASNLVAAAEASVSEKWTWSFFFVGDAGLGDSIHGFMLACRCFWPDFPGHWLQCSRSRCFSALSVLDCRLGPQPNHFPVSPWVWRGERGGVARWYPAATTSNHNSFPRCPSKPNTHLCSFFGEATATLSFTSAGGELRKRNNLSTEFSREQWSRDSS